MPHSLLPRIAAILVLAATFALSWTAAAEDGNSLAGQLLVAAPGMPDPRFAETVIFMVRHDRTGAMGIVINRPVGIMSLEDVLSSTGQDSQGVKGEIIVHTGGPVGQELGFLLHSIDYKTEGTIQITDRIAMSGRPEVIADVARGKGPRLLLLAFGYAGWSAGQLEGEMTHADWFSVPADEAIIFDDNDATKWQRASARRGIDL
ncbi:MAG: YqgE/AlgH family protein [Alphaproteobacteria bacterium]